MLVSKTARSQARHVRNVRARTTGEARLAAVLDHRPSLQQRRREADIEQSVRRKRVSLSDLSTSRDVGLRLTGDSEPDWPSNGVKLPAPATVP